LIVGSRTQFESSACPINSTFKFPSLKILNDSGNAPATGSVFRALWNKSKLLPGRSRAIGPRDSAKRTGGYSTVRALAKNRGGFDEGVGSNSRGGCAPHPSSKLAQMGAASQRIISNWGPERFASGLKAAAECAFKAGPKRASMLDRTLLAAMMKR
jgi:hypothetical protein